MYIIGENIHIISQAVKDALAAKDREFFMELAQKQVEAGAKCVDVNLGPRKKDWAEVFPWRRAFSRRLSSREPGRGLPSSRARRR